MDSTSLFIEGTKIYAYTSMAIFFGIAALVYFATRWDERSSKVASEVAGNEPESPLTMFSVGEFVGIDTRTNEPYVYWTESVGKLEAGDKLMVIKRKKQ